MSDALKDAVRALEDQQAITALIYDYCRAVDRIDIPLGQAVFHADGTADYGDFYQGSGRGAVAAICESHRHLLVHSHQVSNIILSLGGDQAGSEAYHTATIRMLAEGRLMQITVWGRYLDRWARRDGRWGITHRQVLRDFDELREVTPASAGAPPPRDASCPSYAVLTPG